MILSNELPDFKDDAGVIATRFVILQTVVSFLGREDLALDETLAGELPGILNWAVAGWQRLVARGWFLPPGGGANEELGAISSPVKAFVAECCELGGTYSASVDSVFEAYKDWCGRAGLQWSDRLQKNQFSAKLHSAFYGQIHSSRPRVGNTAERARFFDGIRIKAGAPKSFVKLRLISGSGLDAIVVKDKP
jgi:putative DNA primase/helicase